MENEVLVKVEGLSKKFCKDLKTSLWYGVKDIFGNIGSNAKENLLRPKEFWAVRDVSFELRRGECLGLIGHNGAGKSTLLKMLNGLINPDEGKITMNGRVGALIELGAGFNPILTGRENIYNNGAVLGFTKKEIDAKVEDIIEFAEIREFIDMPVQNYSSGMKVRLGFAVASEMEPDILIIDEVLAVGDVGFRVKCLNRISKMLEFCTTIFVSHGMPLIARTATRIILMDKGQIEVNSHDVSQGIEAYFNKFKTRTKDGVISGNRLVDVLQFSINGISNSEVIPIEFNSSLMMSINVEVKKEVSQYFISIAFIDAETKIVANLFSSVTNVKFSRQGKVILKCGLDNCLLGAGNYNVSIAINQILSSENRGDIYYHNTEMAKINVYGVITAIAPVQFIGNWQEIPA
ncbi:ABC transporter ATP-binding protein [Patiriisocius sp. Uisw_017]|jgi:lipopolysaccharide transport system ATP-binding protein|uniref:ABC transporter ATP-binding protein n=1 Tax=Patiriisocius sp. Uisw_017 TaxID=3230968 RepID=UPI0039E88E2D